MGRRAEVVVLVAALTLLALISVLRFRSSQNEPSYPSTYDTGPAGYAALYDMLQQENVKIARFERPLGALPKSGTLAIAGNDMTDLALSSSTSRRTIATWVKGGGRLIVLGAVFREARDALGLPPDISGQSNTATTGCSFGGRPLRVAGDFSRVLRTACGRRFAIFLTTEKGAVAVALRSGRGQVVEIVSPTVFDNLHLALRGNAAFAYDLFSAGGRAMFDERIYGYEQGRSFWSVLPLAARLAIAIALTAVLLAIVGANLPFAPPLQPQTNAEQDSSDYITSLALMLQRGGVAAEIIARLAKAAAAFRRPAQSEHAARQACDELRALADRHRASAPDVLKAGTLFAQLRKDYEW